MVIVRIACRSYSVCVKRAGEKEKSSVRELNGGDKIGMGERMGKRERLKRKMSLERGRESEL